MNKITKKTLLSVGAIATCAACTGVVVAAATTPTTPTEYITSVETKALESNNLFKTVSMPTEYGLKTGFNFKITNDGMKEIEKLANAEYPSEDNSLTDAYPNLYIGVDSDTQVLSNAQSANLNVTAGIGARKENLLSVNAVVDKLSDSLFLNFDEMSEGWGKFNLDNIAISDSEQLKFTESKPYSEEEYEKKAKEYLDIYLGYINDDNCTLTDETLCIGNIKSECKKSTVHFDGDTFISMLNDIKTTAENDEELQEIFSWGTLIDEEELNTEGVSVDDVYMIVYTDSKKDIVKRELTVNMTNTYDAVTPDSDVEQVKEEASIRIWGGIAKDKDDFAGDYGFIANADGKYELGCIAELDGERTELDKLAGTIRVNTYLENPDAPADEFNFNANATFEDVSYLEGLDGYLTGTLTIPLDQFNTWVDTLEGSEEPCTLFDNSTVVLNCSKDGRRQLAELTYLKGSNELGSVACYAEDYDADDINISVPTKYTEYTSIDEYSETLNTTILEEKLYSLLGLE